MDRFDIPQEALFLPEEVATLFRVSPKTVQKWAKEGLISCVRTPGGHRRYPADEVMRVLRTNYSASIAEQKMLALQARIAGQVGAGGAGT